MRRHSIRLLLIADDCESCELTRDLVGEMVRENRSLGLRVHEVDAWSDATEVVASGATVHPTIVLEVDGDERARIAGSVSKRALLRKVLPALYPDDRTSLRRLREQLHSPGEEFPTGPWRGRSRRTERAELLRNVPLFSSLNKRELLHLARLADEIEVESGTVLTEEGQDGDEFFVLCDGAVEVRKGMRMLAMLGRGQYFGEMSLLDDRPRSATIKAVEPCTLLVINRADFTRLIDTCPSIMKPMLWTMCQRIRDLEGERPVATASRRR